MNFFNTREKRQTLILLLIFLFAIIFRMKAYYNRTSIGNNDTHKFIDNSSIPFFTCDFFTSNRPPVITTMYKFLEPSDGYRLSLISEPGLEGSGSELDRQFQPGLDRVVLAQSAISIFCWGTLAWVFCRRQRHFIIKILSIILILSFAFSPQLADWDGVLLSESISFALFALVLAFSIELAFRFYENSHYPDIWTKLILSGWLLSITLWVFSRDANAYCILITIVLLLIGIIFKFNKKYGYTKYYIITLLILGLIFFVHNQTLKASDRWINPFFNNFIMHVLPYDERVDFFRNLGMPITEELLAYEGHCCGVTGVYQLDELMNWVTTSGYSSYSRFLMAHPLWAVERVWRDLPFLFSENRQPFFFGTPTTTPIWFIPIGNILHPTSSVIIAIDLILLTVIILYSTHRKDDMTCIWSLIYVFLFINISGLLFVSYLGDAAGLIRHVLVAVMPYRLMIWLLLSTILDVLLSSKNLSIQTHRSK